jgi:hypothetical protein
MAQISKINGIPLINTAVTGLTYDGINTFTIEDNFAGSFAATMNSFSAATVSATTFYGDGANITGINAFSTFSSTTAGQTSVVATNVEDLISYSGINVSILTNDTNKIMTFSASTGGGGGGETNDGANVGSGAGQIYKDKTGVDINFRTLQSSGATVNIATSGNIVNLESAAGGGESNTASNVGGGEGIFFQKSGVDLQFYSLSSTGGTVTITNTGDTINLEAAGGSSRITSSVQTTNASATEIDKIDTLTDDATNIVEVYIKAWESGAAEYGVWKRTLTVTKSSGTVVIREENADVDKTSAGLNANSISFAVNSGDIDIDVTGIAATTIDWECAYEIIL